MKYVIKITGNSDSYITDLDGDPGRTRIKSTAQKFTKAKAAARLKELTERYPNREFTIKQRDI